MISVIIPIYNLDNYLQHCLNSLLLQTYRNYEVLLIDDGSKDNSATICQEFVAKDNRFHYIKQENSGVSSARNTGLNLAAGEYIAFVDGDDIIAPYYLERLLQAIKGNALSMCLHERVESYDFIFFEPGEQFVRYSAEECAKKLLLGRFPVCVCGALLRRHFIGNLRFPVGIKNNEDKYFIYHYLLNSSSKSVAFTNQKMYGYYIRYGSAAGSGWTGSRDTIIIADEMHKLTISKHPDWQEQSLCNLLAVRLNALRAIAKRSNTYKKYIEDYNSIKKEVLSLKVPNCAPSIVKIEYTALKMGNTLFLILIRTYNGLMSNKMRDRRNERVLKQK